jgi:hypothetical protein
MLENLCVAVTIFQELFLRDTSFAFTVFFLTIWKERGGTDGQTNFGDYVCEFYCNSENISTYKCSSPETN